MGARLLRGARNDPEMGAGSNSVEIWPTELGK